MVNIMNRKVFWISALLPFCAVTASAQTRNAADTVIKSSTIEITHAYKPEVKQAVKQDYSPVLPPADPSRPSFQYDVPEQALHYSYRSLPIRPLSMGMDSAASPLRNYVKAGLGNLRTLYLDAGIGALRGPKFASDIHAGFLSQKGDLAGQKQTTAALDAAGIYHGQTYDWDFGVHLSHSDFGQYGYDHDLYPSKVATRQSLTGGRISAGLQPRVPGAWGLSYHPVIYAGFYTGNNITNETSMGLNLPVSKQVDSNWSAGLVLAADAATLSSEFYNVENNVLRLQAGFDYNKDAVSLRVYLGPAIGQNGNSYLLPDMKIQFRLDEVNMKIGGGIQGKITRNLYSELYAHNPYIYTFPSVQTHSNEVFGFLQMGLGNHITLSGRVSWWQYNYLPAYLNEPANRERMFVAYETKVNAISIQGGLRYQVGNNFSLGANLLINNYYKLSQSSRLWHTPANRITGDLLWLPLKGLSVSAYASYVGQNYAVDASGTEVKLKDFLDLGFGAEYEPISRWSLFLNINNLLDSRYERWYGYPAYGINIYGGIRFKF